MTSIRTSKKAQFYIIAAVVLCTLAVNLVITTTQHLNHKTIFEELKNNFLKESSMAINGIVASGDDVYTQFDDFVDKYRDYALSRKIDFDLVYFLLKDDTIYVKNNLGKEIKVETAYDRVFLNNTDYYNLSSAKYVTLTKDSTEYNLIFDDRSIQLKAIFEISSK